MRGSKRRRIVHHERGIAHRAEHHLGLCHRRHDVRGDAARDQPDGVVRLAEQRIGRPVDARAVRMSDVDQLVDRRLAELGKRRVRRPSGGLQHHAQDAARRETEPSSVGSPSIRYRQPAARGSRFARFGTFAAALLADHEQQPDARLAVRPQHVGRCDLRRENPLGVARAAAVDAAALETTRKERRHAVEVRREDDLRRARRRSREDVEAVVVRPAARRRRSPVSQEAPRQERGRGALAAGGRVDVDQRARQRDEIDRPVITGSTCRSPSSCSSRLPSDYWA